jgi:syntaxin 6
MRLKRQRIHLYAFLLCLSEVQKALQSATNLYERWSELINHPKSVSKEEYDWTTNELCNSLRSIEWDLEDLEETIDILYMGC